MSIYIQTVDLENRGGYRIALYIIRELYKSLFEHNGHKCIDITAASIAEKEFEDSDMLIGYGIQLRKIKNITEKKCKLIIINTDPLNHRFPLLGNFIKDNAFSSIDYIGSNIDVLKNSGFTKSFFMPPTYSPILEKIYQNNGKYNGKKDIDVFFYGAITDHRKKLIKQLEKKGVKIFHSCSKTIPQFNNYLKRCKIVLSIYSFNDIKTFDYYRCSYLISNSILVVHEDFDIGEVSKEEINKSQLLKQNLLIIKRKNIANKVMVLLQMSDKEREKIAHQQYLFYKKNMNAMNYNISEIFKC